MLNVLTLKKGPTPLDEQVTNLFNLSEFSCPFCGLGCLLDAVFDFLLQHEIKKRMIKGLFSLETPLERFAMTFFTVMLHKTIQLVLNKE